MELKISKIIELVNQDIINLSVEEIRNYIFSKNLVNSDGTIRLNEPLQTLLKIQSTESISYLDLIAGLIHILV
jgi:hypothetical protein